MTKYLKNSSKSFSTSITTATTTNINSNVKKLNNNSHSNSSSNNKNKSNKNYKSIYSDNNNTSDNSNHYSSNNGACGSGSDGVNNKFEYQLSFYGWKKKCLFVLLFTLILLIIINLILTLWILNVMEFSWNGVMGQLKIISGGGIQLSGQTLVLDLLRASIIRSKHGQAITIESSKNFTIQTLDPHNNIENLMYLDNKNLEFVIRRNFRIQDQHGQQLFGVDQNEIVIGSSQLRIESDGGVLVNDSMHVAMVRAEAGKKLVLEARQKKLDVKGFQEIFIQSKAGYIDGTILKDIKLHSIAGNIRLDSSNIFMPNLKIAQPTNKMSPSSSQLSSSLLSSSIGSIFGHHLTSGGGGTTQMSSSSSQTLTTITTTTNHHNNNNNNNNNYDKMYHKVYQLCSCASGKLFLTSSHTLCSVDDSNVCR